MVEIANTITATIRILPQAYSFTDPIDGGNGPLVLVTVSADYLVLWKVSAPGSEISQASQGACNHIRGFRYAIVIHLNWERASASIHNLGRASSGVKLDRRMRDRVPLRHRPWGRRIVDRPCHGSIAFWALSYGPKQASLQASGPGDGGFGQEVHRQISMA